MNVDYLPKISESKKGNRKLQDYSIYFEETPPTIFRSKWLKALSKKTRKFKLHVN